MKRNISAQVSNLTTINFCGKPIMWQMDCRMYEPPYETVPTTGEHDFNTCKGCQNRLSILTENYTLLFEGKKERKPFPLCCDYHAELAKTQGFKMNDFLNVPKWTAEKVIYTHQHIANHINTDNYYQEITDYISYTIDSFGETPNDSEPLFLSSYFSEITCEIERDADIPKDRKDKLLEHLKSYKAPKKKSRTDLNLLISTYEEWFKIFPWGMSFFAHLKPQFQKLPIFQSASPVNKYSGKVIAKPHTKSSLIEMLLRTTDSILTQINSLALYEKGLLTNPQQVKLDLILNERRLKLQQGYVNKSPNEEQRYRSILKAWFADEKKFIDDITNALPAPQSVPANTSSPDWDSIIETLPSGCIDAGGKSSLLLYLNNGVAQTPIQIKNRKFATFYRWLEPLWDSVPHSYHISIYDSIHENFINESGNKIPMTTISSQKNRNNS